MGAVGPTDMYARTFRRTGCQGRNFSLIRDISAGFEPLCVAKFRICDSLTFGNLDFGKNHKIVCLGRQLSVSEIGNRIRNSVFLQQEIGAILVEFGRLGGLRLRQPWSQAVRARTLPFVQI